MLGQHALNGCKQINSLQICNSIRLQLCRSHSPWQPGGDPGSCLHSSAEIQQCRSHRRHPFPLAFQKHSVIANAVPALANHGDSADLGSSNTQSLIQPRLLAGIVLVLLFGVANRVLYKMALVPMQNYVFFLAQFQNIGYLIAYFCTLGIRYRSGLVTDSMLALDKRPLWAIGACEAVAQLLFMVSASHLPGPLLPVINQSFLVWNLAFAALILKTKFTRNQLAGAAMITLGVMLAAVPPSLWASLGWGHAASVHALSVNPVYVGIGVLCFAFPALAAIIKDMTFKREKERLGGQKLDIFIVNSFGSLYQSVFVLLLLPITSALYGVALTDLPQYLGQGALCFQGLTPACGSDCAGAPLLPVMYVAANLAFNVAVLMLLRAVGSVTTTIVGSCLVPLTILAFSLPLPVLPRAVMSPGFIVGATLLCLGLVVYNSASIKSLLNAAKASLSDSEEDLPSP